MHVLYFILTFGDNSKVLKSFLLKKKNSALWSDMSDGTKIMTIRQKIFLVLFISLLFNHL